MVPQVVAYGRACIMSFTAYGTPSSAERGLRSLYLHKDVHFGVSHIHAPQSDAAQAQLACSVQCWHQSEGSQSLSILTGDMRPNKDK